MYFAAITTVLLAWMLLNYSIESSKMAGVSPPAVVKKTNKQYYISPVLLHLGLLKATENGAVIISEQEPVARKILQFT